MLHDLHRMTSSRDLLHPTCSIRETDIPGGDTGHVCSGYTVWWTLSSASLEGTLETAFVHSAVLLLSMHILLVSATAISLRPSKLPVLTWKCSRQAA